MELITTTYLKEKVEKYFNIAKFPTLWKVRIVKVEGCNEFWFRLKRQGFTGNFGFLETKDSDSLSYWGHNKVWRVRKSKKKQRLGTPEENERTVDFARKFYDGHYQINCKRSTENPSSQKCKNFCLQVLWKIYVHPSVSISYIKRTDFLECIIFIYIFVY